MGEVLGLLGGVGGGKSTVAGILARRGLRVLDADAEARAVAELPEVRAALAARFGADVLDGAGRLDRARLAARAFASPGATADLNALVHPRVRERLLAALDAAGDAPVVLDVPLLLESPLAARVTRWIFVQAPERLREERVAGRGWPAGERARREAQQAGLAAKRSRAGHVLENSGTIEHLERQVDALLRQIGIAT
ncbi:MAG TPA: dephospho-CoA kinase [Planctomycetota bacterium]|nr:dephospho-CoA kinase [Planctomycetota bacterium]